MKPYLIENYLKRQGAEQSHDYGWSRAYYLRGQRFVVPLCDYHADYTQRVWRIIDKLAEIEQRPRADVAKDIWRAV